MNMKNKLFLLLLILFIINGTVLAQQGMHSSGGDATGEGGSFSYSFGQFTFENYFTGSSSVAEGVQHPFENNVVPPLYSLFDSILNNGELLCYNAQLNLTVAGDEGDVIIQNGATSDFIAGRSILFQHGFSALPGSYMHGYITSDGTFCDGLIEHAIVMATPPEKSTTFREISTSSKDFSSTMGIKIYPNPNHGQFTVELLSFTENATVDVFTMIGSRVHQAEIDNSSNSEICLPFLRKGIYLVKVSSGKEQFIKKIVVE